ncbi:SGNH/GDSL hydrolase family protein [Marmoricola sp. RAF53]|uniref:SGNH/GDSL hydrolase family protein n=1 Tax=Marmoricola sp. RAF53 TaxID=3233059 RepID=UPI003F976A48
MRRALLGAARIGLVAVFAASAAGCGSGGLGVGDTEQPVREIKQYVALGDAYASAPYAGTTDPAGGCLRSQDNYPALVAAHLKVDLTDVTCTGATSDAVLHASDSPDGSGRLPAQLDALTPGTDLVTLTVGIQDADLLNRGFRVCMVLPCGKQQIPAATLAPEAAAAGQAITQVVRAIQDKAPSAYIVVVGYPKVIPDENPCPAVATARAEDYAGTALMFTQFQAYAESAARQTGSYFADLWPATSSHDVCSTEPWVRPASAPRGRNFALMPLAPAQQAAADAVDAVVQGLAAR